MSENTVYTLAKTLQKTDGLEKDFAQMLSALRDTVEKEYLLKIRSAANAAAEAQMDALADELLTK